MPTNKNRVMFLCDDTTKNDLQEWAEKEKRSISNLVEKIVSEAVADWRQQQPPPASSPQSEKQKSKSQDKKSGK